MKTTKKNRFASIVNVYVRTATIKKAIAQYRAELKRKHRKSSTFPVEPVLTILRAWTPVPFNEQETADRIKALI